MKISIFHKPYVFKAFRFFTVLLLLTSAPAYVHAGFFSDIAKSIFGGEQVQAEGVSKDSSNSQTVALLAYESPINLNQKSSDMAAEPIIGQDGCFIESNSFISLDVSFEKSKDSDQILVYTVKEGDTLSEVAESFDISMNTIIWENDLSGKNISIGQKLNILPVTGVKHVVKKGDTLSKIADKYEAESNDILVFNGLSADDLIKKDDIVFVPNGVIKAVVVKKGSSFSSASKVSVSNTKVQSGYYLRPAVGKITSPYGPRRGGFHYGVDIGNSRGTLVVAAADGVVIKVLGGCIEGSSRCGGGYGNYVVIQHSNGTKTRYAHLAKISVSVGQKISQGNKIASLGNTGSSSGPHLHFEIENANGSKMRPSF